MAAYQCHSRNERWYCKRSGIYWRQGTNIKGRHCVAELFQQLALPWVATWYCAKLPGSMQDNFSICLLSHSLSRFHSEDIFAKKFKASKESVQTRGARDLGLFFDGQGYRVCMTRYFETLLYHVSLCIKCSPSRSTLSLFTYIEVLVADRWFILKRIVSFDKNTSV